MRQERQPTPDGPIAIVPLHDAPDALPHCARWLNREWGQAQGHSLAVTTQWLREVTAPGSDEAAFVALDGEAPVGVCLLVDCDLETRAELTPWVSGFYVVPDYRRRSIGSRLLTAVEQAAGATGAHALYLYTHTAESLCIRRGWRLMERFALDGTDFALMVKALD
jgi:GNAT superfamily N-acetyltransferase